MFFSISYVWWPIAVIEKKLLKSRKNFHNQEKKFGMQKNVSESKETFMKSRKKIKIEKNISEFRKTFQN